MASSSLQIVPPKKVWSDIPTPPRRELLWIKDGKRCHWCQKPTRYHPLNADGSYNPQAWDMATIDHVLPRFKGGTDDVGNLVSACRLCNNRRSHEDNCGFLDGALLGKFDPDKGLIPKRVVKKKATAQGTRVALTADDKKAVFAKMDEHKAVDVLREQRDQALKTVIELRREMKHYEAVLKDQEQQLKTMTVWKLIRKRIAERIAP